MIHKCMYVQRHTVLLAGPACNARPAAHASNWAATSRAMRPAIPLWILLLQTHTLRAPQRRAAGVQGLGQAAEALGAARDRARGVEPRNARRVLDLVAALAEQI